MSPRLVMYEDNVIDIEGLARIRRHTRTEVREGGQRVEERGAYLYYKAGLTKWVPEPLATQVEAAWLDWNSEKPPRTLAYVREAPNGRDRYVVMIEPEG